MLRNLLAPAALLLAFVPALAQDKPAAAPELPAVVDLEVTGTVHDAEGKPVADAPVAENWAYTNDAWRPSGGARSDAAGKFTVKVRTFTAQPTRGHKLMTVDAQGKRGALLIATPEELKKPPTFTLAPLCVVSGKLVAPEGHTVPDGSYVSFDNRTPRVYIGAARTKDAAFSITLPAGSFTQTVGVPDMKRRAYAFKIEPGKEAHELAPVTLELTELAKAYGKPAPAIAISHVRNLPTDLAEKGDKVTLADFKGRWVMLEFWGFW